MTLSPEQRLQFIAQAEKIQGELKQLLHAFRQVLDENAPDEVLTFVENDLYDALDCLSDFIEALAES